MSTLVTAYRPGDRSGGLRFLQTDPVPGGSANAYDYALQDPINGSDLNGMCSIACLWHHVTRLARKAYHQAVRGVALLPYAVYYAGYKVNKITDRHWYTKVLSAPIHPLMWGLQLGGMAGDVILDGLKGVTGFHESVFDEHRMGYLNPFHGSGPGDVWLPGLSGSWSHPHFDFGW